MFALWDIWERSSYPPPMRRNLWLELVHDLYNAGWSHLSSSKDFLREVGQSSSRSYGRQYQSVAFMDAEVFWNCSSLRWNCPYLLTATLEAQSRNVPFPQSIHAFIRKILKGLMQHGNCLFVNSTKRMVTRIRFGMQYENVKQTVRQLIDVIWEQDIRKIWWWVIVKKRLAERARAWSERLICKYYQVQINHEP